MDAASNKKKRQETLAQGEEERDEGGKCKRTEWQERGR